MIRDSKVWTKATNHMEECWRSKEGIKMHYLLKLEIDEKVKPKRL